MNLAVTRLELDSFDALPLHSRRCVFWEVDPGMVGAGSARDVYEDRESFESEFDKEAWISGVLLEWGTCGQVAIEGNTGTFVGTAFYAPPGRVPRSQLFPTSPVSADAVLLSTISTRPGFEEAAPILLDSVLTDLVRRGVRAVEAFGIVRPADSSTGQAGPAARPEASAELGALESMSTEIGFWSDEAIIEITRATRNDPQGGLCTTCMMDASFLKNSGFDVVASHPRFPRFRLELDEGLGWKHEVEHALDQLVVMAALELAARDQPVGVPMGRARRTH